MDVCPALEHTHLPFDISFGVVEVRSWKLYMMILSMFTPVLVIFDHFQKKENPCKSFVCEHSPSFF